MRLVVKQGERTINEFHFDKGPIYIGRHTKSQVLLPDNVVSRQHAVIQNTKPGYWVITDLGSANKTYLNGKEIHETDIKTGDVVRISSFSIEVNVEESQKSTPGETIKLDKALSYQQELTRAMTPRLPYRTDTYFGQSLQEYTDEKRAVALYASENEELIPERSNIFLTDGSHTYYLFLALTYQKRNISIVTNSLGIAGEYSQYSGKINKTKFPSNGVVDAYYGGLFELKELDLAKELSESTNIIISFDSIDSKEGPSIHATRAAIRRKAIESGCPVTILCDYHTLSHDPKQHDSAPLFVGDYISTWRNFIKGKTSRIITTNHPDMPEAQLLIPPWNRGPYDVPDKPHSWQMCGQNSRRLAEQMHERFIEVDIKTFKQLSYK